MQARPSFLNLSKHPEALHQALGGAGLQAYQPLLGLWLIDMALVGRWVESPPSGSLRGTFCDDDFLRVTGLKGVRKLLSGVEDDDEELRQLDRWLATLDLEEDDEDVPLVPKACHASKRGKPAAKVQQALSQLLLHRRKALLKKPMDYRLPLFQNVERAGRLLSLSDAERAVLVFAACVSCFSDFRSALMTWQIRVSTGQLAEWVSALSGQPLAEVRKALQRQSVLMTAGMVKLERDEADLEDKLQLTRGLRDVILEPLHSDEALGARMLRRPTPATLSLADFPHLAQDIALLRDYLRHVLRAGVRGSNVLLYGPPGCGKSLLARHVADALGMPLRQKRASDLLDKYVGETEQRIAAMFQAAQDEGAVLLLDEADSFLCDRLGAEQAWQVTQTNEFLTQLEAFDGIFFATTNLIDRLDPAVLRHFSHKIRFDVLTAAQRWRLFQQETARLGIAPQDGSAEESALQAAVQRLDGLTPGDMAAALQRVKLSAQAPTATTLWEALAAEVQIKRHGKGPMGFV